MTNRLWPVDAVGGAPTYSGRALRQALMAPLLPGATTARPLGSQSGVRPGTPSTTVSVTGSTWTVAAHAGVLDVETAPEAGPYGYAIDAAVTGAVSAAHATYTRWDGIYVQLSDPAEADGTPAPGVAVVYVAGVPAAAPTMPAQPARSLLLARIVVPKSGGGAASVVWLAPFILDGPPSFPSLAELQLRHPSAPVGARVVIGQRTASTDTLWEYEYDGYRWAVITAPWTALGISSGFSGFDYPAVRIDGGLVNFRGSILGPMPNYNSTTIATVPVGFRPPSNDGRSMKPCTSSAGAIFPYAAAWASGEIVANPGGGGGTLQILLGGLSGYSVL